MEFISRTFGDKKKGSDLCMIYPSQAIQFLPDGMPFLGHREPGLITHNMTNRLLVIHDELFSICRCIQEGKLLIVKYISSPDRDPRTMGGDKMEGF